MIKRRLAAPYRSRVAGAPGPGGGESPTNQAMFWMERRKTLAMGCTATLCSDCHEARPMPRPALP